MTAVVEVSDVELYELDFGVGFTDDLLVPKGTSRYYYSFAASPDERYLAFLIFIPYENIGGEDRIGIWDLRKKELVRVFDPHAFIRKLVFMPTRNYIVTLVLRRRGGAVRIYTVDGELVKHIEFVREMRGTTAIYEPIANFAISPDSKRLALDVVNMFWIYDIESEEIVSRVMKSDLGYDFRRRMFWPRDNGLVVTTVKPSDIDGSMHDDLEEYRRYPRKYATLLDPYSWEIYHRVPVRYSTSLKRSGDAYFVSPDGEYVAMVNKYLNISRFKDFDARGWRVGKVERWRTVEEYRTRVEHVGWSPSSKELIYEYKNGFVTLDYERNEATRLLVLEGFKRLRTSRVFWLRDGTICFTKGREPLRIGMFKL